MKDAGFDCPDKPSVFKADAYWPYQAPKPVGELECTYDGASFAADLFKDASTREAAQPTLVDEGLTSTCGIGQQDAFQYLASGSWLLVPSASLSVDVGSGGNATSSSPSPSSGVHVAESVIGAKARSKSCADYIAKVNRQRTDSSPLDLAAAEKALDGAGFTCKAAPKDAVAGGAASVPGSGTSTKNGPTGALVCSRSGVDVAVMGWADVFHRKAQMQLISGFSMLGCSGDLVSINTLSANTWGAIVLDQAGGSKVPGVVAAAAKALGVDATTQKCPKQAPMTTTTLVPKSQPPSNLEGAANRLKAAGFTCQNQPTQQDPGKYDDPTELDLCGYGDLNFELLGWKDQADREASDTPSSDPFFIEVCSDGNADSYQYIAHGSWRMDVDLNVFDTRDADWPKLLKSIDKGFAVASKALAVPPTTKSCNDSSS